MNILKPYNYYFLRIPIMSVFHAEHLLKIKGKKELYIKIEDLCKAPIFKEAIFLASPALFNEMEKMLQGDLEEEKRYKILESLFKYIIRSCTRCTPFGLFSGVSSGYLDAYTKIEVAETEKHKPHLRLDMSLLNEIIQQLLAIPEIKDNLKFYPNTSVYRIADKINYFETEIISRTNTYNLTSVDFSDSLNRVLNAAKIGLTKLKLIEVLTAEGYTNEQVEFFINELIENQILTHKLAPYVTGKEPIEELIIKLAELGEKHYLPKIDNFKIKLCEIWDVLKSAESLKNKKSEIKKILHSSFGKINYKGDFFQVDLAITTNENKINGTIISDISKQVTEVISVMPIAKVNDLEKFKNDFQNRYNDQELPLTQVLDNEYGIGYGNLSNHLVGSVPLISEVSEIGNKGDASIEYKYYDKFINLKLYESLRQGDAPVEITSNDLDTLKLDRNSQAVLPKGFYLLGNLLGKNTQEIDKGNYNFLLNISNGPSSSTLMSRFCHLDNDILKNVQKSCINEESSDESIIYAEVIHAPQPDILNIIHRPVLRKYEISFLSHGEVNQEYQISVDDLYVSIKNGTVTLRSKRLKKRVIPRLTTAHNFISASIPLYKFLCDLQFQGQLSTYSWNWSVFSDLPFLPRVFYKKIILSPSKWNIHLSDKLNNSADKVIRDFIKKYQMPNCVVLVQGDKRLLINFDNEISFKILVQTLKKNRILVLSEYLYSSEDCFITNESNQRFIHELIIPLYNQSKSENKKPLVIQKSIDYQVQRDYLLGSEWIYLKIYGGFKVLNNLLKSKVPEIVEYLKKNDIIDKWFFIRYRDPNVHIRLRFHVKKPSDYNKVIDAINYYLKEQIGNKSIFNIQYDTYQREIERYNGNAIVESEAIFHIDSEYSIKLMNCLKNSQDDDVKWLVALKSIQDYLDYFGLDLKEKSNAAYKLSEYFYPEFGVPNKVRKKLNTIYRKHSLAVEKILNNDQNYDNVEYFEAKLLMEERGRKMRPIIASLLNKYQIDTQENLKNYLISSYIHMSVNRFFTSYQRKFEMILYHFLERHYNSTLHRLKNNSEVEL